MFFFSRGGRLSVSLFLQMQHALLPSHCPEMVTLTFLPQIVTHPFLLKTIGRPRLRWEDCVKRDVRKAGEEEDWKKTRDRGGWKRLSDEAVKKLRAAPHP